MPDLIFDNVSITYAQRREGGRGTVHAVKNVSLTLPAGGTLGVAGESGSGKSTLAMSVLRLLPANAKLEGHVKIGDKDVSELTFGQLRAARWSDAAIVFQGAMHSLNPVHTVGEQIFEALELHVKDRWNTPALRKARLRELLDQVEIPRGKAGAYPHQLSGGQKQRIMIAMALACEPDIIIADEPTTALDVIVQDQVLTVLRHLVHENGISLLMISHDLSVLATACERIAVMRNGELLEVGPSLEVCTHPREAYTKQLADAFPTIGDPASRMRPATRRELAHAESLVTDEVLLEARDLNVTFHSGGEHVRAVKNVNFACRKGEIVALVGQSGSGKTTLARTLLGLEKPDAKGGGQVVFRGKPLGWGPRALKQFRQQVQMVLQDPTGSLNPKVTVYESVAEGLRIQRYPGDEREQVARSLENAELAPAADYFGALPQELSGGQRQRVVIASALALEPEVLIADEPVASLDASARGEVLALFLELKQTLGLSAVVITHDLGLAWNIADTVAVMYRGEIVESGETEKVLLDPQHEYTKKLLAAVPRIEREGAA
ncbi:ABC transporter ATP-binding protein [Micrococcales bacterium 31B]|nr:ABC transporter ATP-binding protein [Micrococcales bacterium 31B]